MEADELTELLTAEIGRWFAPEMKPRVRRTAEVDYVSLGRNGLQGPISIWVLEVIDRHVGLCSCPIAIALEECEQYTPAELARKVCRDVRESFDVLLRSMRWHKIAWEWIAWRLVGKRRYEAAEEK